MSRGKKEANLERKTPESIVSRREMPRLITLLYVNAIRKHPVESKGREGGIILARHPAADENAKKTRLSME